MKNRSEIEHIEDELTISHRSFPVFTSLLSTLEVLKSYREELEKRVAELTAEFKKLKSQEEDLCRYLAIPPLEGFPLIPKNNDKLRLKFHIDELKELKSRRLANLASMKQRILYFIDYLKSDNTIICSGPVSEVIQADAEPEVLSETLLSKVDHLMDQYLYQYETIKSEEENVFAEIESLTRRLDLPSFELPAKSTKSPSERIELGRKELSRLRELRLANLSRLLDACIIDLESIWTDCSINTSYRQSFRDKTSMEPTEENLTRLENEINKWKHFRSSHEDFYSALTVWGDVIQQIKAIELKRQDPIILKNRGGILLKLDKEDRKLRHRDLPNHTAHLQSILTQESQGNDTELFSLVSFEGHALISEKENCLAAIIDKSLDPSYALGGGTTSSMSGSAVKSAVKQQVGGFVYAKRPQITPSKIPQADSKKPRLDQHNTSTYKR
nr:protein regulator of cytokinesis 1 [Hymenolepis microstoma]